MKSPLTHPEHYLRYIVPSGLFGTGRTRQILASNPTAEPVREDVSEVSITVYDYCGDDLKEHRVATVEECFAFRDSGNTTWINIDGIRKADIEALSRHFGVHPLLIEDILSLNQRPKMDEIDDVLYCLLNMLYFNQDESAVEQEQISIVLGKNFVLTFQEDPHRDVFDPIRDRLRRPGSKHRQRGADYLAYSMLDLIVDNYFLVMEKLGDKIELLEEEIIRSATKRGLARINLLRKELIILKRNIAPVRDLLGAIIRSENPLLHDDTARYFKDVHDHIIQAYDLSENYRDIMLTMQDLYINNVNLKMNEVMKVMAVVTCLLAPATVIGGIFGMNFDVIPTQHNTWGFYSAVGVMIGIPLIMLIIFKRRGWF